MQNLLEALALTSLDHDKRAAIASCVASCAPIPDYLRAELETFDRKPADRRVSEVVDVCAITAFAPRIAARLAALPPSERAEARTALFAQLEALL